MDKLLSDRAQIEISNKILDILRAYRIDDWTSEPYHQHKNYAERRYQTIKHYVNKSLDRTGAPESTWLLCLRYVCYLLNRLSTPSLNYLTPYQLLTGQVADISAILHYSFYQPVYYTLWDTNFTSQSKEASAHWVGIEDNVGDTLTHLLLTDDTHKIIP